MTQIELLKFKLDQALRVAKESQGAYHHAINMRFADRHVGPFNTCTEETCAQFRIAITKIEELS